MRFEYNKEGTDYVLIMYRIGTSYTQNSLFCAHLKTFSSLGYPIMLQKGWLNIGEHIVNIYKACILGHTPNSWEEVKVVSIPKPRKDDYTSPKSFRPISLTSTLVKGLERLVDRYMKEEMFASNSIHNSQHAFQQGKSTETALHEL